MEFLDQHMDEFKIICERQPVLWKYNTSGYKLANVYDDEDIIRLDKKTDFSLTEEEQSLLEISDFFGKEYDITENEDEESI
jgi:hypothetical protein